MRGGISERPSPNNLYPNHSWKIAGSLMSIFNGVMWHWQGEIGIKRIKKMADRGIFV